MLCPRYMLYVLSLLLHMEILAIISTSGIWQSLPAVFMLQNTEAFVRISCGFLREDGLES